MGRNTKPRIMFKTNEYYDGRVKSIAFSSGQRKATVGVMAPGEYEFNTQSAEQMKVVTGEMYVKLEGDSEYKIFKSGERFFIKENSKFNVKVEVETSYLCLYE